MEPLSAGKLERVGEERQQNSGRHRESLSIILHNICSGHNEHDGVSNHQRFVCLPSRLFRCRSKKILKFRVNRLCDGNPPVTDGLPLRMASNAENVTV